MIATTLGVSSCKKEKSTTIVVPVPTISMEILGPKVISLSAGSPFVDTYGANFHNEFGGIDFIPTATKTNLDLANVGFYSSTYTGKTQYGYTASANRLVLLSSASATEDFSGVYTRTSNSQTVTVTKEGPGLYKIDNVGGVPGNPSYIFDIYFGKINTDSTIVVPTQISPLDGGNIRCDTACIKIVGPDTILRWNVIGGGFGDQKRIFKK